MEAARPSSTAEMVASWRALEALLPAGERVLHDPYAAAFLGPKRGRLIDLARRLPPRALLALVRRIDRAGAGVRTFVNTRHRAIDEQILARAGAGRLEQLVLLGTGYDSRAFRLREALGAACVFEVDHPATAQRRARLSPAAFGATPSARRVSVVVDFERDDLEQALRGAGFDPTRPTLCVWEGVVMYLESAAVQATLQLVARLSQPGALLCFDVWCPPQTGAKALALRDLPRLGMRLAYNEPFRWAPAASEVEPFLRAEGLTQVELTSATQLARRYGVAKRPWLDASSMYLCFAEVTG